jgi:hypothetical protein
MDVSEKSKDAYMDYMKVNESMFKLRLKIKKENQNVNINDSDNMTISKSLLKINGNGSCEDQGISMLASKEFVTYERLMQLTHIVPPIPIIDFKNEFKKTNNEY